MIEIRDLWKFYGSILALKGISLQIKDDEKIFKENSSKGGFIHLFFAKPDQPNKEFEKINYIKYIEKLDWVIGTGEYIKDAKKSYNTDCLKDLKKDDLVMTNTFGYTIQITNS